jgi:transposase InsO family protein
MDFMSDSIMGVRIFRTFNVMDDYTREAIQDAYLFTDIREVLALTEEWIEEYNERRPHEALQNRTPSEWKQQIQP